jgi:uncharacterized protein
MRLTLDAPATTNLIRGYSATAIRVGAREIAGSIVVSASTLIEDWRPRSMAELTAADLEPVLALKPAVLLLGSGAQQVFPPGEVLALLHRSRIGFEVMTTGAACRTYNVLIGEGRDVVAALIVERGPPRDARDQDNPASSGTNVTAPSGSRS